MSTAEIQQKLKDGIAAIRAGEKARGRDLLLEVVEADADIEPAWLWLAAAVDDPADKIIALENALTLNPQNARVRAELERLKPPAPLPQEKPKSLWEPEEPEAAPVEEPPTPAPRTPVELPSFATAVDPTDDPLQCPYCGKLTAEEDKRCPHCRKELLISLAWKGGLSLYIFWLLFGLAVQASVIETMIPIAANVLSDGSAHPLIRQYVEPLKPLGNVPWGMLAVRAGFFFVALFFLLAELPYAFVITAGVLAADVAVNTFSLWRPTPFSEFAVVNLVFSVPLLLLVVSTLINQAWTKKRLFTEIERGPRDDGTMYRAAQQNLKAGRLALAAVHLRQAMRAQPREVAYYKQLALVQTQLGRLRQARQTLELGLNYAPRDAELKRLLAKIEK